MRLEERSDALDLGRVPLHDRVRIADRYRYELDSLELFRGADLDGSKLLLDQLAADSRLGDSLANADPHLALA